MEWLYDMQDKAIFQIYRQTGIGTAVEPIWANIFIGYAYKHGISWARNAIKSSPEIIEKLSIDPSELSIDGFDIEDAFNLPINADRVGVLYSRVYSELKNITAATDVAVSRILAEGMIRGLNPTKIAREIANKISVIGKRRAIILARTEIIRAHHLGSIQEYRNLGLFNVKIEAEWNTAGDDRVCELCAPMDGKIFTLDKIEGMIPLHPQCRCGTIPYLPEKQ